MITRRARLLLCALGLAFAACALSPLPDLPSTSTDDGAGGPVDATGGTTSGTGGIGISTGGSPAIGTGGELATGGTGLPSEDLGGAAGESGSAGARAAEP